MKRVSLAGVTLAVLAVAAIAASGCSSGSPVAMDTAKVWGYVASPDKAQLELDEDQDNVKDLVVKRVLAPSDAWVVVHADMDGEPGARVGLTRVKRGESLDVRVPLEGLTTPKVIVAVHADRGASGEFEFDMMNKEMSPDRPFFVNEAELAAAVTVRDFGVPASALEASLIASPQIDATKTITISRVQAPADSWVVVHLEKEDGAPGQRVGLLHVDAGETEDATIKIDPLPLTDNLIVALHADLGDPGLFNFDMDDTLSSLDQPYFVDGEELAIKVPLK